MSLTETLFALVSGYGPVIIAAATYLSCLAVPIPSSFVMLAGGAFVASGDLGLAAVAGAAFGGAVLGDQTGYRLGRAGGARLAARIGRHPARAAALDRARATVERWGGIGVFFSTWLLAPLGPWVNVVAGATGMPPLRFTLWDAAGEAVWVALYVGLGYAFAAHVGTLAAILGNGVGALTAAAVTVGLGAMLVRAARRKG